MKDKIEKYFPLVFIVIISMIFCENKDEYEFEPLLNIACILRNDESYPVAIIDRTYSMNEPGDYDLQDAIAWISGAGVVDTLRYVRYKYFASVSYLPIMPESTYRIVVQTKNLPTLTGSTKIPGRFTIISPQYWDTVLVSDTIKFTKGSGHAVYYVFCKTESSAYTAYWIYFPGLIEDSIVCVPIKQFQEEYINNSGLYHFLVVAHDSNYYNYEFHWKSDYPAYGIENGMGFFGSAWAVSVMVYINVEKN